MLTEEQANAISCSKAKMDFGRRFTPETFEEWKKNPTFRFVDCGDGFEIEEIDKNYQGEIAPGYSIHLSASGHIFLRKDKQSAIIQVENDEKSDIPNPE